MIKAILACDDTGGVSKDGTLPWPNNPKDLKWFKDNTTGDIVIMGSTTWKDPHMPRPLPNRYNVVVTSRVGDNLGADYYINAPTAQMCQQIELLNLKHKELTTWIIGGPNIINQTIDLIEEFYLSRIPGDFNCDTHLPLEKIKEKFTLRSAEDHPEVRFEIWERKRETIS